MTMTNDDERIVRMLRVSESDPVQQEAADAIERLTADLAATRAERDEQKRRADYLSKDFDRDIKMYQAEVAELRTNLAAANARAEDAEQRLRVQEKWIGRAEAAEASYATLRLLYEAAEAREIVLRELLHKIRNDYSAALMPEDTANIEALL
jgi:hypothetical protein